MATLYITEYDKLPILDSSGSIPQAPVEPAIAEQHISITGSSAASAAFNVKTKFVMLNTDSACSLAWAIAGGSPTAAATAQRMGANETRFYGVPYNGKLAVISNT